MRFSFPQNTTEQNAEIQACSKYAWIFMISWYINIWYKFDDSIMKSVMGFKELWCKKLNLLEKKCFKIKNKIEGQG